LPTDERQSLTGCLAAIGKSEKRKCLMDDRPGTSGLKEGSVVGERAAAIDKVGLLNLLVVYVVWGTTYLAIRVAVREGSGFPPFTMGTMRVLTAGILLLAWGALSGQRLRLSRQEFTVLAVTGLLMWAGGNGLVVFAEQRADSGLAALMVAAVPLWGALIEGVVDRRPPTLRLALSLLIGFGGIVLLSAPQLRNGAKADVLAIAALVLASFSWAIGSLMMSRRKVALSPQVSSGYQHLFGSLGFALLILLFREPRPIPTAEAWWAWAYLVVFGSIVGYTAYVQVLRLLPVSIGLTYAYANPVIAVGVGALILREPVTPWTVGGAALVLLGVAGVFRERTLRGKVKKA
jgi:drug/metabolite transporter (DMT)-like permease